MSSTKKPTRVSILPLPETRGIYKIQMVEGVTTATLSKEDRLEDSPTHVYDPVARK